MKVVAAFALSQKWSNTYEAMCRVPRDAGAGEYGLSTQWQLEYTANRPATEEAESRTQGEEEWTESDRRDRQSSCSAPLCGGGPQQCCYPLSRPSTSSPAIVRAVG